MSVTEELNDLIALHGNCRDALNVTLAKLRQAQNEISVLKEAAQQSVQATGRYCECENPSGKTYESSLCWDCDLPRG